MPAMTVPTASTRFRPRADAALFSRLVQDAWKAKNASLEEAARDARVGEIIASMLEARYPAEDMAVLARYHHSKATESCTVRVWNPKTERWDYTFSIPLPRPVPVPSANSWADAEISACGPRFSEMAPNYGLKPTYRATLSDAEFAAYLDDHKKREAGFAPKEVEPFFRNLVDASNAYRAEYRSATDWPSRHKAHSGEYPRWSEIEARFPVIGAYIASLRERSPLSSIAA